VYLAWDLSGPAVLVIGALAIAGSALLLRLRPTRPLVMTPPSAPRRQGQGIGWALALVPLYALSGVALITLFRSGTEASINTPWVAVPALFWTALGLGALTGAAILSRTDRPGIAFLAVLPLISVGLSVALAVYRLGYGFDPFIHQAAERHILEHGLITPKTPYYAGQYALVVLLARATGIGVATQDAFLVPTLAVFGLAGALAAVSRRLPLRPGAFAAATVALLPLAPFVNTTPFSLAAVFTLLAGFCGLAVTRAPRWEVPVWIFTAGALMTHPLAGIPCLTLALLIRFRHRLVRLALTAVGALALPILFSNVTGLAFSPAALRGVQLPFELPATRFNALGDLVYGVGAFAAVVIVLGLVAALRERSIPGAAYALAAVGALLGALSLALWVSFSYLPDYEQGGYPARLLILALILALPPAAVSVGRLIERLMLAPYGAVIAIFTVAFLFTGGVYLAYPRSDAYVLGRGWSTSRSDVLAVRAIHADAGNEPYIVLANQAVSAAALREYGFFRYHRTERGEVFAYPVPTGGPLYPFYLQMIYGEPSAEYMRQAMEFAGVHRGYLVVNTYWTRAEHVIGRAKTTSTDWFGVNSEVFVFRYAREPSTSR